ncbi:MAG: glycosyltransferase family 4 protein [Bacteroidales bacterium]|nr:glycosyltransferase family 4 protein [Bacteroidales bacterium]
MNKLQENNTIKSTSGLHYQAPFRIIYIVEKFPSSTEYFILNEILSLEKRGFEIHLLVLRKQKHHFDISEIKNLKSHIIYLPKIYFYLPFIFLPFFRSPFSIFPFPDFHRHSPFSFLKYLRNYCISKYFAAQLKNMQVHHIHAHFGFIATDIAKILSRLIEVTYSFTVHAQDIYLNQTNIEQEVAGASFVVTCTEYNRTFLNKLTKGQYAAKLHTIYHGIDVSKWKQTESPNSGDKNDNIKIVSVARLVEKKGLIYLLKAIRILKGNGTKIHCTIIGNGPLQKQLKRFIIKNNLTHCVRLKDLISQEEVKQQVADSDIFVLPCIVVKNGDRDGLPNVLLEAMAMGIPVISTNISAIPELIKDEETGLLVSEKNETAIADAILRLNNDNQLYNRIAENGERKVKDSFDIEISTNKLVAIFEKYIINKKHFKSKASFS